MSHFIRATAGGFFLLLCLGYSVKALGQGIQGLVDSQRLLIDSYIESSDEIVIGQEVSWFIKIKTDRWFGGGTRFTLPEIPHAVVKQRDQFASNTTELVDGKTWTVQVWEISIFPQTDGVIRVPPIALSLTINQASDGNVRGEIKTPAIEFSVVAPAAYSPEREWLAATQFVVTREWDASDFKAQAGESLQLVVHAKAHNTLAMFLPKPKIVAPSGLAIYPGAPQLVDKSERGDKIAHRTDVFDIVVEKRGTYRLPPISYSWWDLESSALREWVVPGIVLESGNGISVMTEAGNNGVVPHNLKTLGVVILGLFCGLAIFYYLRKRTLSNRGGTPISQQQLLKCIIQSAKNEDYSACCRYLYQWLDRYQRGSGTYTLRAAGQLFESSALDQTIDEVLAACYDEITKKSIKIDASALNQLMSRQLVLRTKLGAKPVVLSLNP